MNRSRWFLLATLIVLVGAGLRIHAASADRRFHADEALFASFARHASLGGDWMLGGELDKPPLAIYAQAVSMTLTAASTNADGVLDFTATHGEFAARLPALFSGIILVAVVIALARRLYGNATVAVWAGLFAALSPLAIVFSGSAFLDMPMLMLAGLGLLLTVRGRWGLGGLFLGLAVACKLQGVMFIPLALILGLSYAPAGWRGRARFALAIGAVLLGLSAWDASRGEPVSLFATALAHNPGAVMTFEGTLTGFARYIPSLLGAPTAIFMLLIPVSLALNLWRGPRNRALLTDLTLMLFALAVLAGHAALGQPLYDRYGLLIWIPVVLVSARAGVWIFFLISRALARQETQLLAAVVAIAMGVSAVEAANFRPGYSIAASSFPDHVGIDAVAAYLNDQHTAAVVYDHWANWLLGYYLGEWSSVRRVYYPTPDALVADALLLPECELRFFVSPGDANPAPWVAALREAGFIIEASDRESAWIVYAINPAGVIAGCAESASPG